MLEKMIFEPNFCMQMCMHLPGYIELNVLFQGLLGVWSLSGGGEGVVRTHLKAMEIPYNTKGFNPGLPTAVLSMDVDEEDFLFKKGQCYDGTAPFSLVF